MKVRFGIVGLGGIANRFASVLNTAEEAELVAVAARDLDRAEEFARKYRATKAYGSYLELICDEEVDVVYIGLTHNFHYEIAMLCLENGKGVICEKPFFICKQQAQALFDLAASKRVLMMEAMWTRCLPAYRKAKEWGDTGKIGKIKLIDASFCFQVPFDPGNRLYNPDLAGGALLDAGVYPIEFAIGIAGSTPEQIHGTATMAETGVDDFNVISIGFANGILASLSAGITAPTSPDAKIYGTDGYIIVYDFLRTTKCERYDKQGNLQETFEEPCEDGFIYEIQHFVDLYQKHAIESDLIPWKDTIACAEVFDVLRNRWEV